jgi:hypothetical protein
MKTVAKISGSNIMVADIVQVADGIWSGAVHDVGRYKEHFNHQDIVYFKREDCHFIPFPKDILPDTKKFYAIKYYEILARITEEEEIPKKSHSNKFTIEGFNVF